MSKCLRKNIGKMLDRRVDLGYPYGADETWWESQFTCEARVRVNFILLEEVLRWKRH